jgi:hypothetical protein
VVTDPTAEIRAAKVVKVAADDVGGFEVATDSPRPDELAGHLELGEEEVLEALTAVTSRWRYRWTSQPARTLTFTLATWWPPREPGRSQRTCWPCATW